jgi:hypothetical protein
MILRKVWRKQVGLLEAVGPRTCNKQNKGQALNHKALHGNSNIAQ